MLIVNTYDRGTHHIDNKIQLCLNVQLLKNKDDYVLSECIDVLALAVTCLVTDSLLRVGFYTRYEFNHIPNKKCDTRRLCGPSVACWTTDHYHRGSDLGVVKVTLYRYGLAATVSKSGISEICLHFKRMNCTIHI